MRRIATLCLLALVCCTNRVSGGERVSFRTQDGFLLEGRLQGDSGPAIVFAHMEGSDQSAWFDFASTLSGGGFTALTFNFRGHGASEGAQDVSVVDRDIGAAVEFVGDRTSEEVILVGAGVGGTAALIAAAETDVAGVVTLSAPERVGRLDAVASAVQIDAPTLLIAAQEDRPAARSAEALYLALGEPREIEITSGGRHGTNMLGGRGAKEVEDLIRGFIVKVFDD